MLVLGACGRDALHVDQGTCDSEERTVVGVLGSNAVFLPERGRVLIAGGVSLTRTGEHSIAFSLPSSVKLYDPLECTIDVVAEMPEEGRRAFATATRGGDGSILFTGGPISFKGSGDSFILAFDETGALSVIDRLPPRAHRSGAVPVALADGRVLITGGEEEGGSRSIVNLELFDPASRLFVDALGEDDKVVSLHRGRRGHAAVRIGQDVIVAGGFDESGAIDSFEIVRSAGDRFRIEQTPATLSMHVTAAAAASDDTLLMLGNRAEQSVLEAWKLGDTLERHCSATIGEKRVEHTLTIAGTHAVIAGGRHDSTLAATVQIIDLPLPAGDCLSSNGLRAVPMRVPRFAHDAVAISEREVMLFGGGSNTDLSVFDGKLTWATEYAGIERIAIDDAP